ncbi:hypothetical protein D3C78_1117770 [compost metagenome]
MKSGVKLKSLASRGSVDGKSRSGKSGLPVPTAGWNLLIVDTFSSIIYIRNSLRTSLVCPLSSIPVAVKMILFSPYTNGPAVALTASSTSKSPVCLSTQGSVLVLTFSPLTYISATKNLLFRFWKSIYCPLTLSVLLASELIV